MPDKVKNLGQVMTPQNIVNHMIDDILNLTNEEKQNYLFLDNSCGNGAFVKSLLEKGVPKEHIFACDIDEEISDSVKKLLPLNNFRLGSFFKQTDWENKFDIVIGNPPYVRIHNLMPEVKMEIENFSFCVGMYDLYYAFYEYGLKMLKPTGRLLYITPNSFLTNASGKIMRDYIGQNNLLRYFENFEATQNFDNYSTYTCIIELGRQEPHIEVPWKNDREKVGLSFNSLQNGLATLADSVFISDNFNELEQEIIRPIIKASTGEIKQCIFPPSTEEELKKYPKAYNYLLSHKVRLEKRALQSNTKWFQFGRSQGLVNINNEKIAIGSVMSEAGLKYYRVGKEYLVYSGLYATADDLDKLEKELQDEKLIDYLIANGKPMRGGYYQISSTLLNSY